MQALGIDIGGSGIKAAPVNLATGALVRDRYRIPTPQPSTPRAVVEVVKRLTTHFQWRGRVGITFPGVVRHGVLLSAANMHKGWIGVDAPKAFRRATKGPVTVLNDADAAGLAEMTLGAGKRARGVVLVLTFGTGIGSALFVDGRLVPNTELGHVELRGRDAELRASERAREDGNRSWVRWAQRVDEFLHHLEMLFSPDLFIIGGGASKKADKFLPLLTVNAKVVPARLRNEAGIVGAALATRSR